jgi:hypothetical protein
VECLRLRVKDLDFGNHQIIVRAGKACPACASAAGTGEPAEGGEDDRFTKEDTSSPVYGAVYISPMVHHRAGSPIWH